MRRNACETYVSWLECVPMIWQVTHSGACHYIMEGEWRMNLCTFVGRVTKDPEIRYSQDSQMAIAKFVLAVDRNYKAAEGEESADFFPCVAFDKRAEFAQKHLYKGIRIAINGKMRNNNYTNRNGEKVYGNSLYVDNIEFADGKRDEGQVAAEAAGTAGTGGQAAGGMAGDRGADP